MSWLAKRDHFQKMACGIDPAIRIYSKNNAYWRAYSKLPWLGDSFLTQTATVIGPLHWYPENWDDISKDLHHEGRHTQQQRWIGLGIHPWVGFMPFAVLSVVALPVLITVRFWLELDAEAFALRYKYRTGSNVAYIRYALVEFADTLSGPDYVWAWPKNWALRIAGRKAVKMLRAEGADV